MSEIKLELKVHQTSVVFHTHKWRVSPKIWYLTDPIGWGSTIEDAIQDYLDEYYIKYNKSLTNYCWS